MEPGIPTVYKSIRFRSRLEATWARFFDLLGWPWQYEPFDLNGYIPDFVLAFRWNSETAHQVLVEVKPVLSFEELRGFTEKIQNSGWQHEALLVGGGLIESSTWNHLALGLMSEGPTEGQWYWEEGLTMKCLKCQCLSFYHSIGSYSSRVCGHYDGDGLLGDGNEAFAKAWAEAKNQTQWAKP